MTTLDKMIRTLVTKAAEPLDAPSLDQIFLALSHIDADVIAFEVANKTLPSIRKRAAGEGVASVLTKGGNDFANEDSTVVISAGHFAELIVAITKVIAESAPGKKPANSILERMTPIHGAGRSVGITPRPTEETVGGHIRF